MKFIIKDWAGNILKEKTLDSLWIELEFTSFDDAWCYLYEHFKQEDYQEFNVEEKE